MLDIKFIRENPEAVKENIRKKFQEEKLPLVDQVLELDSQNRQTIQEAQDLRTQRNTLSKQVGMLMGQAKKDPSKLAEAEALKAKVTADAQRLAELEAQEDVYKRQRWRCRTPGGSRHGWPFPPRPASRRCPRRQWPR